MIDTPATQEIFDKLTQEAALQGIVDFCKEYNYGLAVWRLPDTNDLNIIIDDSDSWLLSEKPLEELDEGFIFSPFDKAAKKYFLKSRIKIKLNERKVENCKNNDALDALNTFLTQLQNKKVQDNVPFEVPSSQSEAYENLVKHAVEAIKDQTFLKVVPSRYKEIDLTEGYSAATHFLKLEKQYRNSFISLTYTPETNLWIGATPEVLIHTCGNTFKTVALAGTQKLNDPVELSDIAWTQKEIEEQALVSRYIINSFKKIRLREFDELGPKTVIAGNLIHLKTEFTVDMEATNFPQLGSVMLDLLHPTSAICGMPLEPAYQFIMGEEKYDRKFFSGYLGPVNTDDSTAIYVNLRCMEIDGKKGTLYAGAGVTENSNPHKEWLETEMKMNTLLNVLKN